MQIYLKQGWPGYPSEPDSLAHVTRFFVKPKTGWNRMETSRRIESPSWDKQQGETLNKTHTGGKKMMVVDQLQKGSGKTGWKVNGT